MIPQRVGVAWIVELQVHNFTLLEIEFHAPPLCPSNRLSSASCSLSLSGVPTVCPNLVSSENLRRMSISRAAPSRSMIWNSRTKWGGALVVHQKEHLPIMRIFYSAQLFAFIQRANSGSSSMFSLSIHRHVISQAASLWALYQILFQIQEKSHLGHPWIDDWCSLLYNRQEICGA